MKTRIFSIILPCLLMVGCSSLPTGESPLRCDFERNGNMIKIIVTNTSQKAIKIYNSFDIGPKGEPAFVQAKFINKDGKILSENSFLEDGYWTWHYSGSSFHEWPIKMLKVNAGDSIEGIVDLPAICSHYNMLWVQEPSQRIKIQSISFLMLKVTIFLDSELERSMTFESDYLGEIQKSSGRILRRPVPSESEALTGNSARK